MSTLLLCLLLAPNPSAYRIYDLRADETLSVEQLAQRLASADVVFLGEDHDNTVGHQLQLQILTALHQQRPDLVLSLEMFERDTQGLLDDYLRGRIAESKLLEQGRPWHNYQQHYRPLVEYARSQKLDVIAACVPRDAARSVSQGKTPEPKWQPFLPRSTSAPEDAYFQRFAEVMREHAGTDEDGALERYYESQCLKDDAMGEAISDYRAAHHHRQPLVVHVCGKFHSDYGQGTAWRYLQRQPLTRIAVVTMEPAEDVAKFDVAPHRDRGHFLLAVPVEPKKKATQKAEEPAQK